MASPRYGWDERVGAYRNLATGRFSTATDVRAALDSSLDAASNRMAALAEELRAGRLTTSAWQVQMAAEIKDVQLYSAAAARGGFAQLTQADYGRVGQITREQYVFLRERAKAIADGSQKLSSELTSRARLYGQAARGTYHTFERLEMGARGYTEEHSVRHAPESCSQCIDEEARGWVPIGTLVPIGGRICISNCKCEMRYRKSGSGTA